MPNHDSYQDKEATEPESGELTSREGLTVRYEIRVATGEEAKLLRRRQADAIRALLLWHAAQERGDTARRAV